MKTLLKNDEVIKFWGDLKTRSQRIVGAVEILEEEMLFLSNSRQEPETDQKMDFTSTKHNEVDIGEIKVDLSDIHELYQSETMEKNATEVATEEEDLGFLYNVSSPLPEQYHVISVTTKKDVVQSRKKECQNEIDIKVGMPSPNKTGTPDIKLIIELLSVNERTTKQLKEMFLSDGYSFSHAAFSNKLSYFKTKGIIDRRPGPINTWYLVNKND